MPPLESREDIEFWVPTILIAILYTIQQLPKIAKEIGHLFISSLEGLD
jgi:hypothetical protein